MAGHAKRTKAAKGSAMSLTSPGKPIGANEHKKNYRTRDSQTIRRRFGNGNKIKEGRCPHAQVRYAIVPSAVSKRRGGINLSGGIESADRFAIKGIATDDVIKGPAADRYVAG